MDQARRRSEERMSHLIDYWPSLEAINQCVRTEAETADDAVLLAVHEPMLLKVREVGTGAEQPRTERELLDAFLAPADDGSAVVVAITGDSGVGKSHMIRWLHAQLQRHSERDRLVIVLIPKTASLRQVVELMLAPLEGPEYERLRHELARATDTLSPDAASQMLAAALTVELKSLHTQLIGELRAGDTSDRSKRERADHARGLQTILYQIETFEHWLQPVLLRIVGQALRGGSEASSGDARRFVPQDLELPEDFDVTTVSTEAQLYIQKLMGNDGAGTAVAARVLQDVLDAALRNVFRFSEALGQRTLEEIVNDIRARLLKEGSGGKELVLLIEDFAALAGIQETLLSLMISESDYGGQRIRAPLRTALAVTDGFLPSRQTILTRAKREWVIPNMGSSEEEVIRRLTRMAGRYLNAARWGMSALRDQYKNTQGQDLYAWVKSYGEALNPDEQEWLQAFGETDCGHALFPLSPTAVSALARREMTVDSKLLFNPRKFINAVLRDVLLKRDAQVSGQFPPPHFKGATLRTDADLELRSQGRETGVRDRLIATLAFWAGDPRNLSDPPAVSRGVFAAFGLPWPFQTSPTGVTQKQSPRSVPERGSSTDVSVTMPSEPPPTAEFPPTAPPPNLGTTGLEQDLEAWATGALTQARANRLRNVLATALSQRMDWNSLRMAAGVIKKEFFWLPYAQVGNPTGTPKLVVAAEVRPVPATVRRALSALDRWESNGSSWDYPRAEDDYAYAQALLDQLEQQARAYFLQKAEREAAVVGRTLYRQALMLRLAKRGDAVKPRVSEMLAPAARIQVTDALRGMPQVGQVIELHERAIQSREALRKLYLEKVTCFQGDGSIPHAIDSGRVARAWKSAEEAGDASQVRFDDISLSTAVGELSANRLLSVVTRHSNVIRALRPAVEELAGDAFDVTVPAAVKAVLSSARKAGVLASQNTNMAEIERLLAWMETPEAKEILRDLKGFTEPSADDTPQAQLAAWAKVDVVLLGRAHQALESVATLIRATQRNATAQLKAEGGADVAEKMGQLIASLRSLGETP
jgi:hypothetical protein